jgi:hypothetical protein
LIVLPSTIHHDAGVIASKINEIKMFDSKDEQIIRELRGEYKFKWLEKIFKDYVKEALTEFSEELKKLEESKNPLMTISDVVLRFKICKATLHNWINRGAITGTKLGKNRYFTEEEVREALKKYGFDKQRDLS